MGRADCLAAGRAKRRHRACARLPLRNAARPPPPPPHPPPRHCAPLSSQRINIEDLDCQALILAPTRELAQQIQKVRAARRGGGGRA